jgi:hypothetical protein
MSVVIFSSYAHALRGSAAIRPIDIAKRLVGGRVGFGIAVGRVSAHQPSEPSLARSSCSFLSDHRL